MLPSNRGQSRFPDENEIQPPGKRDKADSKPGGLLIPTTTVSIDHLEICVGKARYPKMHIGNYSVLYTDGIPRNTRYVRRPALGHEVGNDTVRVPYLTVPYLTVPYLSYITDLIIQHYENYFSYHTLPYLTVGNLRTRVSPTLLTSAPTATRSVPPLLLAPTRFASQPFVHPTEQVLFVRLPPCIASRLHMHCSCIALALP